MVSTASRLDPTLLERARRALRRADPRLGRLIRRVGPCGLEATGAPYASLIRSVLHQQLAGSAARAIEARLLAHFGGRHPAPAKLRLAGVDELRALGLSRRKAATLQRIAEAFESGELSDRRIRRSDDDAVIAALTALDGIGVWTAQMILIFSLGRPDVLPVGDYGVRKGARAIYHLPELPAAAELMRIAEPWRPYRSVASWYLWRAADESGRETRARRSA